MIVEIGLHQREPERRRCDISIFGIDRRIVFFYHKAHQEGTKNTEGLSVNLVAEALEAVCFFFVRNEMLKQVQHDPRVEIGILNFNPQRAVTLNLFQGLFLTTKHTKKARRTRWGYR